MAGGIFYAINFWGVFYDRKIAQEGFFVVFIVSNTLFVPK